MELEVLPITAESGSEKYIIYRPLLGLAFVGNQAMADLAQTLANETPASLPDSYGPAMTFLDQIGFLVQDPIPAAPGEDFHPTTVVLLLTNQCQLRCTYCYASAGDSPGHEFSVDVGQTAIDYVCEQAQQLGSPFFSVAFHGGGEPTYAWSVLKACTAYTRSKSLPARISVTSHGVWSTAQRKWILENLDEVSLSLDGRPNTQNRNRPFANGQGSAELVMETVRELDRHRFPYGIRMTVTAPWDTLPDDVHHLCEHTQCYSFQAEPAYNTSRGGHGEPKEDEARAFIDAFLEASTIAMQYGRSLYYSGARPGIATTTFCTAPYGALIVDSHGNLVTCYEVTDMAHPLAMLSNIGRIRHGEVKVNHRARKRLHGLMVERRESCRGCFCYWSCAGDCYVQVFNDKGHKEHGARCNINREITYELILRQIAANGGVWRSPYLQGAPLSLDMPVSPA